MLVYAGNPDGRRVDILFLDDMAWRHVEFARALDRRGAENVAIWRAWSAEEAIQFLATRTFDQVFLDHDLLEEDVMVDVGGASAVPTGMAVVDVIVKMASPPQDVVVHSLNGPAREEMVRRLEECGRVAKVTNAPFNDLLSRLNPGRYR